MELWNGKYGLGAVPAGLVDCKLLTATQIHGNEERVGEVRKR
jgi:hypothetical protein